MKELTDSAVPALGFDGRMAILERLGTKRIEVKTKKIQPKR